MISPSYDIDEFIKAIQNKGYLDVICLANQEAIDAWRLSYRQRRFDNTQNGKDRNYEYLLKEFISLLRAAVTYRKKDIEEDIYKQFLKLREDLDS